MTNDIRKQLLIDLIQSSFQLPEYNTIKAKKEFLASLILEIKPYYFSTIRSAVDNIELKKYIDKLLTLA